MFFGRRLTYCITSRSTFPSRLVVVFGSLQEGSMFLGIVALLIGRRHASLGVFGLRLRVRALSATLPVTS